MKGDEDMRQIYLENAPLWVSLGICPLPVRPGEKHSEVPNWNKADVSQAGAWIQSYPTYHIGILTGTGPNGQKVFTIDMDVKHPPTNGIRFKEAWEIENGALPETLMWETPSGGRQMAYWTDRAGLAHSAPTDGSGSGIDIQADGKFAMVPPSFIPEGGKYNAGQYRFINPGTPIAVADDRVYSFIEHIRQADRQRGTARQNRGPVSEVDAAILQVENREVLKALYTIPCEKVSRDDWIRIGNALKNIGAPVDEWDKWSSTDPARYHDGECEKLWDGLRNNWNKGTIFHLAKEYGYTESRPGAGFHKFTANGKPQDTLDGAIEDYAIQTLPLFIQNGKPRIYEGGCYRMDDQGKEVKAFIRSLILPELVTSARINRIYNLFLDDKRISLSNEDVNRYPAHWINFKNGMLDTLTGQLYPHDTEYHAINQIPHDYEAAAVFDGTVADMFFRGLIPDEDDRNMLFAYVGYCMTIDTRFQKFLVLLGAPGVGKSTANNIIVDVIGADNISSLAMQDLNERFMPAVLLGKLLNVCSDIPGTSMDQTSAIKLITGEDPIKGEYKHGAVFTFRNYAKLLFSANEMPSVLSENPEAFYRRLMIIKVLHKGPEIRNLQAGLKDSIPGLIAKCVRELQKHYVFGIPLDSPNSIAIVDNLKTESDSVRSFFAERLERDPRGNISQPVLYDEYQKYCWDNQWRPKSKGRVYAAIESMGFESRPSNGKRVFHGLRFKETKETR